MIVITGAGIVSAIGNNQTEVCQALLEGREGIRGVRFLATEHREYPVGEVQMSNAEIKQRLNASQLTVSRTTINGILALKEALNAASLTVNHLATTALISGTTVGSMDLTELSYVAGQDESAIGDCGKTTQDMASYFGDWGLVTTCSTACSSAANSILVGANLLRSGRFERVVVGGSECLSRFHFNGFRTLMILDKAPCRPFDADRAGLNLGEGAAFLVMETEASAHRRGVKPLAVLSGWGNACDAFHQTASSDEGEGAFRAMTKALERASLTPSDIDYINVHGTGTPNNDASECRALQRIFTNAMPPISSTKSMTGHTTSASGAIESVICLLAIQNKFIPPTLHWQTPMPDGIIPVTKTIRNRRLQHVLCNSFGFGGNDTSLILSDYEHAKAIPQMVERRPVYVKTVVKYQDIAPETMPKIPPMVARRLSSLLKRALLTALVTLQRVGISSPDAIGTGTAMGCVHDTVCFLKEIKERGEELLKPTHFMQSTHNTIGSLIAIYTHSHGYNNTFSHGRESLHSALLDAQLQIEMGESRNALVGLYDEQDETSLCIFLSGDNDGQSVVLDDAKICELCGDYCH